MGKKLYVGNLPYSTTEDEVRALFSEVGTVTSVALITDRATGRAKGFGFVEMDTEQAAQDAIAKLNGRELQSRALNVSEARPLTERSGGGGSRGGGSHRGGGSSRGGDRGDSRGDDRY